MDVLRAFRPGLETLGNGEIAERTGLSKGLLSRIENGLVSPPIATLGKIADALDLTVPAVKSRLHRARLALREQLTEFFGG